jgi:chorismate mutase/prephenate dehydratase
MGIDAIRRRIDDLDNELLELLSRRAEGVREIGQLKEQNGAVVFDPARERQILDRLSSLNRGPLSDEAIAEIFGAIFAVHRLLEKRLVVAYFGLAGTFSHIAAGRKFGGAADLRPAEAVADVFQAVAKKEADLGVVPIENTTAGVVPLTLDSLAESKLRICAEVYVDIEHYLLSQCRDLTEIQRVYSHPQPIGQCRIWLRSNLPRAEVVSVGSTARAAELAAAEPEAAAIGPALAAEIYGVPILRERIQDEPDNRTRFFVIGHASASPSGRDKTSLLFSVPHKAGALYGALAVLSRYQINMTFIQSHPTKQTPWEYMFFVDVEGHADQPGLSQALAELREQTTVLRVLGSYPAYFPQENSRGPQGPSP